MHCVETRPGFRVKEFGKRHEYDDDVIDVHANHKSIVQFCFCFYVLRVSLFFFFYGFVIFLKILNDWCINNV